MELSELSSQQEASLFRSGLEEWQEGPQVLTYGAILICRKGKAGYPCGDKHHQWDVWFIEGIFRPVGVYLHLAVGIMPVEGVLHWFS